MRGERRPRRPARQVGRAADGRRGDDALGQLRRRPELGEPGCSAGEEGGLVIGGHQEGIAAASDAARPASDRRTPARRRRAVAGDQHGAQPGGARALDVRLERVADVPGARRRAPASASARGEDRRLGLRRADLGRGERAVDAAAPARSRQPLVQRDVPVGDDDEPQPARAQRAQRRRARRGRRGSAARPAARRSARRGRVAASAERRRASPPRSARRSAASAAASRPSCRCAR